MSQAKVRRIANGKNADCRFQFAYRNTVPLVISMSRMKRNSNLKSEI